MLDIGDTLANCTKAQGDRHTSVWRRHRPVIRYRLRKRLVAIVPTATIAGVAQSAIARTTGSL